VIPSIRTLDVHDVIIIGAGPAGLAGARALAERGRDVLVLEEHQAIGYPVHCTGVLGRVVTRFMFVPNDGGHPVFSRQSCPPRSSR